MVFNRLPEFTVKALSPFREIATADIICRYKTLALRKPACLTVLFPFLFVEKSTYEFAFQDVFVPISFTVGHAPRERVS